VGQSIKETWRQNEREDGFLSWRETDPFSFRPIGESPGTLSSVTKPLDLYRYSLPLSFELSILKRLFCAMASS